MEFIAKKFSEIELIVKSQGFKGLWDETLKVILIGEAIIYDFRVNQFGLKRLHQVDRDKHSIDGKLVIDQNPHLKAIGFRPDKENWYYEKLWLGKNSFPVKFKIEKMDKESMT
jgi:hypothetical protein